MLISLDKLILKYRMKITGVIHCGGHFGEEIRTYQRHNVRNIHAFEPCEESFNILKQRHPRINTYKFAIGASDGMMELNIEKANKGQSNSLLAPALHLEQFPDIIFDEVEQVEMRTLDSFKIQGCNFLNMDVQGYELEVLKGAPETLKGIKYIYTEVNRDEVYKNCARIEELDSFLSDFERVETDWSGGTWGDALYIRKKKIETVPGQFQKNIKHAYPPDNDLIFEEWYFKNLSEHEIKGRIYLPVFWTGYYVNNKYGKDRMALRALQNFINSLDKSKKYYTIIQYDDGILNDVNGLDLRVFSMSGHGTPIPLVSKPHSYVINDYSKKYWLNFIGKPTHKIREQIFKLKNEDFLISDKNFALDEYCKIISQSVFTLCPRGYGISSFRIQEAVQYQSIPVYISDKFSLPPDFESYGIIIKDGEDIESVLKNMSDEEIESKFECLKDAFEKYFSYEAVKNYINNNLA